MLIRTENPVKAWRIGAGLLQDDVAKKLKCSPMTVSRAERGLPIRLKIIKRFVKLGAGALSLADFKEQRPRRKKTNGTESEAGQ